MSVKMPTSTKQPKQNKQEITLKLDDKSCEKLYKIIYDAVKKANNDSWWQDNSYITQAVKNALEEAHLEYPVAEWVQMGKANYFIWCLKFLFKGLWLLILIPIAIIILLCIIDYINHS